MKSYRVKDHRVSGESRLSDPPPDQALLVAAWNGPGTSVLFTDAQQNLLYVNPAFTRPTRLVQGAWKTAYRFHPCLGAVRGFNMFELVGDTLWAALKVLSVTAPALVLNISERDWHRCSDHRMEYQNLSKSAAGCEA